MVIAKELELDWKGVKKEIEGWIRQYFSKAKVKKAFIGISGGIDSAVAAALVTNSVGRKKVIGLLLPEKGITPPEDMRDAKEVAELLKIEHIEVEIGGLVKAFLASFPQAKRTLLAYGNLKPRIRMTLLYAAANSGNGLVVGSSDRSEYCLGYFTKWGDAAADIFPLLGLYKSQVRELGRFLELPQQIIEKVSSPGLWKGQTSEKELGFSFELADRILYYQNDFPLLFGRSLSRKEIAKVTGASEKVIRLLEERVKRTAHKRALPPSPPIPYTYFRKEGLF